MKRIFIILSTFLFLLCSCSFFSSSSSEMTTTSFQMEDTISSFEIRRINPEEGLDENIVFSNGGFSSFDVIAKDINNMIIDIPSSSISWRSSNSNIFTVDSSGNVNGKNHGEAVLTAKYKTHEASMPIVIETIAYTFEKKDCELEYRTGSMYYLPVELNPSNASLKVEISDSSIIKLTGNDNTFSVTGVGTCNVTITAYTSYHGDTKTYDYQITTIDGRSPTFYFENKKTNKGEISIPKNKYSELSFSSWRIKAISYEEADITSSIRYHSGLYDLSKVGKYNVTLIVTDNSRNANSYFYLTINVTEYEKIAVPSPIKTFDTDIIEYEFIKASATSYLIKGIIFSINISLISDYEYAIGTIYWQISFYLKEHNNDRVFPYNEEPFIYSSNIDENAPRTQTLKVQIDLSAKANPDTFVFLSSSVFLNGNAFYYRYY